MRGAKWEKSFSILKMFQDGNTHAARSGRRDGAGGGYDIFQLQHHGDFIAGVVFGTADAVAPDFERKRIFGDDLEAQLFEETLLVGEGHELADLHSAGVVDAPLDEGAADPFAAMFVIHGEGANFGEIGPEDGQGGAADDLAGGFVDGEVANGFVELGVPFEEHFTQLGVGGDDLLHSRNIVDGGAADHFCGDCSTGGVGK
jgi:hypothetical protein